MERQLEDARKISGGRIADSTHKCPAGRIGSEVWLKQIGAGPSLQHVSDGQELTVEANQLSAWPQATGAAEEIGVGYVNLCNRIKRGRQSQKRQSVIGVVTLVVGVVKEVEGVGFEFQANMLGPGNLEGLGEAHVHLVERQAASRVTLQVSVEDFEVHRIAGQAVDRAAAIGVRGSKECVLQRVAQSGGETGSDAGAHTTRAEVGVQAISGRNAGHRDRAIRQYVGPLLGFVAGAEEARAAKGRG